MQTDKQTDNFETLPGVNKIIGRPTSDSPNQSNETGHVCECCGKVLDYSNELHCATCHRELWTFTRPYTPHSGFGNSTNLFD